MLYADVIHRTHFNISLCLVEHAKEMCQNEKKKQNININKKNNAPAGREPLANITVFVSLNMKMSDDRVAVAGLIV